MDPLDDLHVPWWNDTCDLPTFLERIATEMRAGHWSPCVEAVFIAKNMEFDCVTILRWGENDGLLSEANLKQVAEQSRTTA